MKRGSSPCAGWVAVLCACLGSAVAAQPGGVPERAVAQVPLSAASAAEWVREWRRLDTRCRGSRGDDPAMPAWCEARQRVGQRLQAQGWCYGRDGQIAADMRWERCGAPAGPSQRASRARP